MAASVILQLVEQSKHRHYDYPINTPAWTNARTHWLLTQINKLKETSN